MHVKRIEENIFCHILATGEKFSGLSAVWAIRIGNLDDLIFSLADLHRFVQRDVFDFLRNGRHALLFKLPLFFLGEVFAFLGDDLTDDNAFCVRCVIENLLACDHLIKSGDIGWRDTVDGNIGEVFFQGLLRGDGEGKGGGCKNNDDTDAKAYCFQIHDDPPFSGFTVTSIIKYCQ